VIERHPWRLAIAVFAAALVLRVVCVVEMQRDVLVQHPAVDQADYIQWARIVAAEGDVLAEPFPRPPGLPYALALLFRLWGPGLLGPRLLQAGLSAAVCLLVFAAGRAWFGTRVGLAAAAVTAVHGVHVHAATEIMPTVWVTGLDALGLVLVQRAGRGAAWGWAFAAGAVLGLSALFLPTILVFAPLALWWVWKPVPAAAGGRRRAAALAAGLALVVLPVTGRNAVRGGDAVLVAANDGINFYIGNNADYARTIAVRPGRDYRALEWMPVQRGIESPSAQSAWFYRQSLQWAVHDPAAALGLQVRKLWLFFHGAEIPRSSDVYLARDVSAVLRALVWRGPPHLPDGLLMPLALVGVAAGWRRRRQLVLPLGFAAAQVAAVCAFFVASRYRAPSLPVWALWAAVGAAWLAGALRRGPAWRRAALAAGVAGLVVLLHAPAPETRLDLRAEEAFYRAEAAYDAKRPHEVRVHLRRTLELDAANNDAWDLLGHVLYAAGEVDSALAAWRRAAQLDPLQVETGRALAQALAQRGDVAGAEAAVRANLAHANDPRAHDNDYSEDLLLLARLALRQGRTAEALADLKSALRFNPSNRAAARLRDELVRRGAAAESPAP
jgi:cytochrome c-type biogenesis protein CcmH/NrfG